MDTPLHARASIPYPRLRVAALLWLLVYVPVYATTYGAWHFLYLCNLGISLTALGLILGQQWLLSSQALIAPAIALAWIADAGCRVLTGHFLHGGTAYMWDASLPAIARILSLYHLAWPWLLLYCLDRRGFDARALWLQSAITLTVLAIGLFLAPAQENLNYVWHGPASELAPARPILRVLLGFLVLVLLVYWPIQRACRMMFRPSPGPF